jgi:hypothetical protein
MKRWRQRKRGSAMSDPTVHFSAVIHGPVGGLMLELPAKSKRDLKDMLFAAVDEYYAKAANDGHPMHGAGPEIIIATSAP